MGRSVVVLQGTIDEQHQLKVRIPDDLPVGQVEVTIRVITPPSAEDLLKLPLKERDKILEKMALEAEQIYKNNPDLTDFEAFGENDLYDTTP